MDTLKPAEGGGAGTSARQQQSGAPTPRRDTEQQVAEHWSVSGPADPGSPERALARALIEHRGGRPAKLPSRRRVEAFVDQVVALLFPQHGAEGRASEEQLLDRVNLLRAELASMLHAGLPRERADHVADGLVRALPDIYERLRADATAIVEGDPAAESVDEVILAYPGFLAIAVHRVAHGSTGWGCPSCPGSLPNGPTTGPASTSTPEPPSATAFSSTTAPAS